jgi:hypothetical protein
MNKRQTFVHGHEQRRLRDLLIVTPHCRNTCNEPGLSPAHTPPDDTSFLVTRSWDIYLLLAGIPRLQET